MNNLIFTLLTSFLLLSYVHGQERFGMFCPEPFNHEINGLTTLQIDSVAKKFKSFSKSGIVKVPIVFHILTNDPKGVSNISDCIIKNQVDILNNCFRKKAGTQGFNTNPVGADKGIEFFLPCKDDKYNSVSEFIPAIKENINYSTLNKNAQKNFWFV